jgi:DNA-binding GntR family transcriptional regulator
MRTYRARESSNTFTPRDGKINMKISEQLCEKIEEQIATGELQPGSFLDEATLVEKFGVSRTPVREALIQLAAEGLIEIRPRRGAVVTSLSPARLMEMFEVMAELEAMCGRLAARRMNDWQRKDMLAAHEACEEARAKDDSDAYFYHNEKFHSAIYIGSQNAFLMEQANQLERRLRPYRRLQLRVRNRMNVSFNEHLQVIDAITKGDEDAAEKALRRHVMVQGERFADLLATISAMNQEMQAAA